MKGLLRSFFDRDQPHFSIAGGFLVAGGRGGSIARFTESGHLACFPQSANSVQGASSVSALAFQADGKLIVGGSFSSIGTLARTNLARVHRDGSLDISFGSTNIGPNGVVSEIVVDPSGNIVIGGKFTSVDGVPRPGIARLYGIISCHDTSSSDLPIGVSAIH